MGVGKEAVSQLFQKLPGIWELGWLPANEPAGKFWEKIVQKSSDSSDHWDLYIGKDSEGGKLHIPGLFFEIKSA